MSIISNYIWEKAADGGINPVSLVLQQVKIRGREIDLFCVCDSSDEKEASMTEQLTEWFHRKCLPACEGRTAPMPRDLLEPELRRVCGELPGQGAWGYCAALLVGNTFCLCGQGDVSAQLINYRYNHPRIKRLSIPLYGRIQRGAGLLLHTPELIRDLRQEEVCQILHGKELCQEEGIGRRLREMYREGRSRGNRGPVGGIYLQVL